MRISLLCSSEIHPINSYLIEWIERHNDKHDIELIRQKADARGGDLLLLISCSEILTSQDRSAYSKVLVIHASDLPRGRGWSPHIWQILEGKTDIVVTLLEAEDEVDTGDIWYQVTCHIPKDALWDEVNERIFNAEISLMDFAVSNFNDVTPRQQSDTIKPTYYTKRTPADSQLDLKKSLQEQFDNIRVSDPNRFPAFFTLHGYKYKLILEKISDEK